MSRLNAILVLVLVGCALAVIQSQHRSRTYFVELERLKKQAHGLDEQWGKLQLEQSTWANPARVDTLAGPPRGRISPPHDRVRVETLVSAP
ncbi:MAG: cell division protein FtsL [Thiobacillus sp.]|nr:cell division protein FtsL [Thiobacillus sp.]